MTWKARIHIAENNIILFGISYAFICMLLYLREVRTHLSPIYPHKGSFMGGPFPAQITILPGVELNTQLSAS